MLSFVTMIPHSKCCYKIWLIWRIFIAVFCNHDTTFTSYIVSVCSVQSFIVFLHKLPPVQLSPHEIPPVQLSPHKIPPLEWSPHSSSGWQFYRWSQYPHQYLFFWKMGVFLTWNFSRGEFYFNFFLGRAVFLVGGSFPWG